MNEDFTRLADLAAERLGGKAVLANDEFFAPKENLLKPSAAVFLPEKFTSRGKWMDGWETRRRRVPGHDWCVLRLGLRGIIRGVLVDTSHFTGNYPEHCSLEACDRPGNLKRAEWTEILPRSPLKGGSRNLLPVSDSRPWTHVRLNIFPDGGVARLRVYGEVVPDWGSLLKKRGLVDLAFIGHGGIPLAQSDMYFGHAVNMIMPGRAKNMGDGWETKRRRGPGHDWAILRLGRAGALRKIEIDTNHFKGNYPDSCLLEGCRLPGAGVSELTDPATPWVTVLPQTKLKAHRRHFFSKEIAAAQTLTHVRLNIYPDGGISRLRLYGEPGTD